MKSGTLPVEKIIVQRPITGAKLEVLQEGLIFHLIEGVKNVHARLQKIPLNIKQVFEKFTLTFLATTSASAIRSIR